MRILHRLCITTVIILLESFTACKKELPVPHIAVSITADANITYQTIENFGASDAWTCQYVGSQWDDNSKNLIADHLFSVDTASNGQPKGIGLSMWRFNIGAGSGQQGDNSGIADVYHRVESFIEPNGNYNWDRQAGQIWFLKAAKSRGVPQFLAFVNSPPVNYTINGKAYSSTGSCNIAPARYQDFGNYVATVINGVKSLTGITFNYVSPVNEPQLPWSNQSQEGCPYNNRQTADVTAALSTALSSNGLTTKIILPEAYKINSLLGPTAYTTPGSESQINDFFNPSSSTYVGSFTNVDTVVCAHDYYNTSPYDAGVTLRQQISAGINSIHKLRYWMSEYCILGDNNGEINGNKRDLGMTSALYLAKTIHTDLVNANCTAWQWWLAISPYDYKDGLTYVDASHNYYDSKMLWGMGNYSRFIRPGAVRIDVQSNQLTDTDDSLLISAYKDRAAKKVIFVIVNSKAAIIELNIDLKNAAVKNLRQYVTSNYYNLYPTSSSPVNKTITIPARSVCTLVGNL